MESTSKATKEHLSLFFLYHCRRLALPISIQDDSKLQKYLDTYRVSTFRIHVYYQQENGFLNHQC